MMARAFGWGSAMAVTRMACSLLSIKVTAVALGPSGLALVAQLTGFVMLMQSMVGQGLVTGTVRLGAERAQADGHGSGPATRPVFAPADRLPPSALRLALVLWSVAALGVVVASGPIADWLLSSPGHGLLIAVAALAVAAGIGTDLLHGMLGVSKEVNLIGVSTIASTVLGLAVFAPSAWWFGIEGALWASLSVFVLGFGVAAWVVARRSRGVPLRAFVGRGEAAIGRQLLGFYPMLVVNGVLPPLALLLVRDTLADTLSLHDAGLWQAAWRLCEAAQAVIVASVALHFMPSLGETAGNPAALRQRILKTLGAAVGVSALLMLLIVLARAPLVRLVFSADFAPMTALLPLQALGEVLKMAGWILCMALVGTLRARWFMGITALSAATFVGLTGLLAPSLGLQAALWAHVATGTLQTLLAAWALRDVLQPARRAGLALKAGI
jgi:PST family polysaccharide transporter